MIEYDIELKKLNDHIKGTEQLISRGYYLNSHLSYLKNKREKLIELNKK